MTQGRLTSIALTDFRSIRGTIYTSLDAPIVLIHGPNGAGKTSVLSGIELALTGGIPSLARVEPDYLTHLVHKKAAVAKVRLETKGLGRDKAELSISANKVSGEPTLEYSAAHFFSERCYLAQSALGRLLEIYQHKDARKSDSPLTQFVKDLLGLDRLDALVEGLYTAGNITRLRTPVPGFYQLRGDIEAAELEIVSSRSQLANSQGALKLVEDSLREALRELIPAPKDFSDVDKIIADLQLSPEETRLVTLARTRRDIDAALAEWSSFSNDPQAEEREISEQALRNAQTDLTEWQEGVGAALSKLADEISGIFPDLKLPSSTNPEQARAAALRAVQKELERCSSLLNENDRVRARLTSIEEDMAKIGSRETLLDNELQVIGASTGALAQQLAALLPHVHTDDCPVCGRDYSEVAAVPLASHISSRISALTERAARLESLSKEKAGLSGRRATLQREQSELKAKQISLETANELKVRRARLSELDEQLSAMAGPTARGMALLGLVQSASTKLDQLRSRNQRITNLHATIGLLTKALNVTEEPSLPIGEALKRLQEARLQQEEALTKMKERRLAAIERAGELKELASEIASKQIEQDATQANLELLQEAKAASDQVISAARALATKAADVRTGIVRRVFNESLNAIWRDLFVRLAPEENFVPAFALPDTSGPVEAMLETIYRSGGKGGNPRAMLSAGNLNTAALTLFLSLHLTAKPQLPWLIIDDPVQSMDELHIAQFAVLLRTLSKAHNRQIILAVHERALFDYLSLELSPAFPDDRLITLELGRAADGSTTHEWRPHTYEPDRAIAA